MSEEIMDRLHSELKKFGTLKKIVKELDTLYTEYEGKPFNDPDLLEDISKIDTDSSYVITYPRKYLIVVVFMLGDGGNFRYSIERKPTISPKTLEPLVDYVDTRIGMIERDIEWEESK